jgi:diaminopimelate epimerase
MSGSGNDFVFFDARGAGSGPDPLESASSISSICAPHLGVGADGVVFIAESDSALFSIRYYNADGSRATLCGNASLCAAQSAVRLHLAAPGVSFSFSSDAGLIEAEIGADGTASVRLPAATNLEAIAPEAIEAGEERIGFAVVGVPHLVVLVQDLDAADVEERGRRLRHGALRAPAGANVNFVSAARSRDGNAARWRIRTYERGVEGETMACGTGAVATAACLIAWGDAPAGGTIALETASSKTLAVRFRRASDDDVERGRDSAWSELSGEGRVVFDGVLRAL